MQLAFGDLDYDAKRKKTRREVFLNEMERVVPWLALLALLALIRLHYPRGGAGQEPYPLAPMLRIHLMQNMTICQGAGYSCSFARCRGARTESNTRRVVVRAPRLFSTVAQTLIRGLSTPL